MKIAARLHSNMPGEGEDSKAFDVLDSSSDDEGLLSSRTGDPSASSFSNGGPPEVKKKVRNFLVSSSSEEENKDTGSTLKELSRAEHHDISENPAMAPGPHLLPSPHQGDEDGGDDEGTQAAPPHPGRVPSCPHCGGAIAVRTVTKATKNAGRKFYVCNRAGRVASPWLLHHPLLERMVIGSGLTSSQRCRPQEAIRAAVGLDGNIQTVVAVTATPPAAAAADGAWACPLLRCKKLGTSPHLSARLYATCALSFLLGPRAPLLLFPFAGRPRTLLLVCPPYSPSLLPQVRAAEEAAARAGEATARERNAGGSSGEFVAFNKRKQVYQGQGEVRVSLTSLDKQTP